MTGIQFISKGAFKGARLSPLVVHVASSAVHVGVLMVVNIVGIQDMGFPWGFPHPYMCRQTTTTKASILYAI